MDTVFMNSEKSKNSESHILILKLTNKLDLRICEKTISYQILGFLTLEKLIQEQQI